MKKSLFCITLLHPTEASSTPSKTSSHAHLPKPRFPPPMLRRLSVRTRAPTPKPRAKLCHMPALLLLPSYAVLHKIHHALAEAYQTSPWELCSHFYTPFICSHFSLALLHASFFSSNSFITSLSVSLSHLRLNVH